jgi:hypothetical protein
MKPVAMVAIHGQRVLIYPGSVIQRPDPGPFSHETVWSLLIAFLLVSTPAEVGLPYEEINLKTSDGIKLRAYVLVQKRELKGARTIRTSVSTDAEVSARLFTAFR